MGSNVVLTAEEWNQVMAIIATASWKDANPLLMKIGAQLRAQQANATPQGVDAPGTEVRQ